jgi:transcriptional regulator
MAEGVMPRMMRMILPFRLEITSVDGTWKLSQNKDVEVRLRAADALAALPSEGPLQEMAAMMRKAGKG